MIGVVAAALFQAAGLASAPPPLVTWTVTPDTVTVAEPFTVTVVVRAPAGTPVEFPPGPDSTESIEAVDPPTVDVEFVDSGIVVRRATYRLTAWSTGTQFVPLAPVTVGIGAGAVRYNVQPQAFVRSVLRRAGAGGALVADSEIHLPKDALAILPSPFAWWPLVLAAIAALAALWWWRRRRGKRRRAAPPPTALAVAQSALARVDALGLLEAGEPSRHIALHADVLRGYLSARADAASRSHTNTELLAAIRGYGLPNDRIAAVLQEADQVQFARRPVSIDRARDYAKEIQSILETCEEHFARSIPAAAPPKRAA